MTDMMMALPLLPGKWEALKAFANTLLTTRRAEYDQAQVTVQVEDWFAQSTPMGDLVLVRVVSPDPAAVLANLAASEEPFDIWFRSQVQELTGVDLSQPPPTLPEHVFHWAREE